MRRCYKHVLIGWVASAGLAAGPSLSADQTRLADIALPSGQVVSWLDTVPDAPGPEGLTLRFRFLAPAIARDGGTVTPDQAQDDMQVLCDRYALPRIASTGPVPSQIVISLSDRPVAFGVPDEAATQLFDAFAIVDGKCEVQVF